uniref:recombinase family protein n=1 Tax=Yoonia sp. TaxID=2212373 RepID=UPI0040482F44
MSKKILPPKWQNSKADIRSPIGFLKARETSARGLFHWPFRRDIRENFLTLVVSWLSIETTEQLKRARAEPLETTGFGWLRDDGGAATHIDRLARSLSELLTIVTQLKSKGAHLAATQSSRWTHQTPLERHVFDMLSVFAEFETNLRRARRAEDTAIYNIMFIMRFFLVVPGAHSLLGCDKSPILLESEENGRWPTPG